MDGDILPFLGTVGDEFADEIIDTQLALRLQYEDRHSRELLGHGAKMKARLGCNGNTLSTIREPIPLIEQNLAILSDQDRACESAILGHLHKLRVQSIDGFGFDDKSGRRGWRLKYRAD